MNTMKLIAMLASAALVLPVAGDDGSGMVPAMPETEAEAVVEAEVASKPPLPDSATLLIGGGSFVRSKCPNGDGGLTLSEPCDVWQREGQIEDGPSVLHGRGFDGVTYTPGRGWN